MRFRETRLIREESAWRLVDGAGHVLLELSGSRLERAIDDGYLDPELPHHSMFEYARLLEDVRGVTVRGAEVDVQLTEADARFLEDNGLTWD